MKYLRQMLFILLFCFIGEALARLLPLPIPASIYGLLLLFIALMLGIVPLDAIKDVGNFLLTIMPVLFIAPAIRILNVWDLIQPYILPISLIIIVSTVVSFAASGLITQQMMKYKGIDPND